MSRLYTSFPVLSFLFIIHLVKHLVLFAVSLIPASFQSAYLDTVRFKENHTKRWDASFRSVRFVDGEDVPHKRRRRGHRGGKKHRKFKHHDK